MYRRYRWREEVCSIEPQRASRIWNNSYGAVRTDSDSVCKDTGRCFTANENIWLRVIWEDVWFLCWVCPPKVYVLRPPVSVYVLTPSMSVLGPGAWGPGQGPREQARMFLREWVISFWSLVPFSFFHRLLTSPASCMNWSSKTEHVPVLCPWLYSAPELWPRINLFSFINHSTLGVLIQEHKMEPRNHKGEPQWEILSQSQIGNSHKVDSFKCWRSPGTLVNC